MTLRSPKKPQTTVPRFLRLKALERTLGNTAWLAATLALAGAVAGVPRADAQQIADGSTQSRAAAPSTTQPGWNLRWRRSPKLTPQPVHVPSQDVFAKNVHRPQPATASVPSRASGTPPKSAATPEAAATPEGAAGHRHNVFANAVTPRPVRRLESIQQAGYIQQSGRVRQAGHDDPVSNYQRPPRVVRANNKPARVAQADDLFNNPFNAADSRSDERTNSGATALTQQPGGDFQLPENQPLLPPPPALEEVPALKPATPPPSATPQQLPQLQESQESLRDLLNDPDQQIQPEAVDALPSNPSRSTQGGPNGSGEEKMSSPSDKEGLQPFLYQGGENPFDQARPEDRSEMQSRDQRVDERGLLRPGDTSMITANELSCEEFRERIARETIDTISLDPSPPFRPDLFDPADYQRQREKFEKRQVDRSWTGIDGRVMASGRLVDLAYEQVVIETEDGVRREVSINDLSEGDLAYLSDNWGLPRECLIEQVAYTPRSWAPMRMTWKASNLCHKPLYFEEVNLERYGHTAGPWLQPVVSSAHFFANIAVLPYKMGVHTPGECQYALGYYRPGNCAPWIIPPVPISARGALSQAAVMTGTFWLVP